MEPHAAEAPPILPPGFQFPSTPPISPVPPINGPRMAAADALYNAISPGSMHTLYMALTDSGLRHEETLYGYFASVLSALAPSTVGFQIGYQHALRSPADRRFHPSHHSRGSDGGDHNDRSAGQGKERDVRYPDITLARVIPSPEIRSLRKFAVIEVKIPYVGDGRADIENNTQRIQDLFVQAGDYFNKVNLQPNALHEPGGYVPVFVTYGRYYTELEVVFYGGQWWARQFKPWKYIFERQTGDRRPLFHVIAEIVGQYWHTLE